jgi:hypothetical protein
VTEFVTAISGLLWSLVGLGFVAFLFSLRKPIGKRLERGGGATKAFATLAVRLLDERLRRAALPSVREADDD